jgi:uncharacterized protein
MDIQGERRLIAGRDAVWRALNDLEVPRDCIPGCQKLERVSDTVIEATIAAQIGPVKAPFGRRIELKDLDPPRAYTLVGEGKSAATGFGRGEARVTLEEEGGVTTLRYTAQLKLGGKIAQIGARLVMVCDVSGSMRAYARGFLQLAHALSGRDRAVELFAFATRLTRLTRWLRVRDPDQSLARIGTSVQDWDSGTRIGAALARLVTEYAPSVLGSNSIVMLLTDGLERGPPEELRAAAERLKRSCR